MHDRDYKYDLPGDKLITFNYNLTMKLILLVCVTLAVVSGLRMEKRAPPICKAGDTICPTVMHAAAERRRRRFFCHAAAAEKNARRDSA